MQTPQLEAWFVTGSQHLYGPAALERVAAHAAAITDGLNASGRLPVRLVTRPLVTTPADSRHLAAEADADPRCAGLVLWMHTFSPAKMWLGALHGLRTPFVHLHTQYHRDLPWSAIDMDFMNLHQAAHGDREAAYLHTRLGRRRRIIVGHWDETTVQEKLGTWLSAASAWADFQGARFARFGDNMRQVAVTEGDKVAAETRFGFTVDGFGVGDLAARVGSVTERQVDDLCDVYAQSYDLAPGLEAGGPLHASLREGARIEIGLRAFLAETGARGFTTTFEDLHGLRQLPGLAVQRLMAEGIGFGAEGDWKTAALLRACKVMAAGRTGGTSFMEDYTYHLDPARPLVLGAHMLEVCPSIAASRPRLEVHPLGIGGREDPVRLVFDAAPGHALNVSLVDLGNRFRLIAAAVDTVPPPHPLPRLPVARAVWSCRPDFATATEAWLHAGGAHHTAYSTALTIDHIEDFASIAGVELVRIDESTRLPDFIRDLAAADLAWSLSVSRA